MTSLTNRLGTQNWWRSVHTTSMFLQLFNLLSFSRLIYLLSIHVATILFSQITKLLLKTVLSQEIRMIDPDFLSYDLGFVCVNAYLNSTPYEPPLFGTSLILMFINSILICKGFPWGSICFWTSGGTRSVHPFPLSCVELVDCTRRATNKTTKASNTTELFITQSWLN